MSGTTEELTSSAMAALPEKSQGVEEERNKPHSNKWKGRENSTVAPLPKQKERESQLTRLRSCALTHAHSLGYYTSLLTLQAQKHRPTHPPPALGGRRKGREAAPSGGVTQKQHTRRKRKAPFGAASQLFLNSE